MAEVRAKNYELRDDRGNWLGQVVLTDDGMFASVTDYGNFSFAWRAYGNNFREFLLGLNTDYFACKMYQGFAYVCANKQINKGCTHFAEKILPALQQALRDEKES